MEMQGSQLQSEGYARLFYKRMVCVNGFKEIRYLQVDRELFANVFETSFHQYV